MTTISSASQILNNLRRASDDDAPQWVKQAALIVHPRPKKYSDRGPYETTRCRFYPEVTVRLEVEKTARRSGKTYTGLQRRRMDLVALVQPNYRIYEPFVIGVEIKVNEYDLRGDVKMEQYLEFVHLFYLAVPRDLRDQAITKIDATPALTGCGLLVVDDALVVERTPNMRRPTNKALRKIYAELLIKPFKQKGVK